jgi:limonene-1,2-epoxide hydrolase
MPNSDASTPSSDRKLEVLAALQLANRRKDKAAVLELVTADVEYHYHVGSKPLIGREKIGKFLDYHWGHTTDAVWTIQTHAVTGDKLLVEGTEELTDTHTGQRVHTPYMGIFEFRDGLIARWRDYFQLTPAPAAPAAAAAASAVAAPPAAAPAASSAATTSSAAAPPGT